MISKLALFVCFGGGVDAFHTPAGSARGAVTVVGAKSKSIPFLEAPKALDGSYAGKSVSYQTSAFAENPEMPSRRIMRPMSALK